MKFLNASVCKERERERKREYFVWIWEGKMRFFKRGIAN